MASKDRNQAVRDRLLAKQGYTKPPVERPAGEEFVLRVLMPKEYTEGQMCSHCLVYTENRVVEVLQQITPELDEVMRGHDSKYFWAKWERPGEIDFIREAKDQNWR
jgi:hypothetical protein